jgi:hypothetical protein
MQNNQPSINLVADRQISVFDKFINWALTIGRLIIIITELIAIAAFLYRFSLDERLANLHSSIKQKQGIVSALKNDESKYRNLQDRISIAGIFSDKGIKINKTIVDIENLIPSQINTNNLIFNKDQISLGVDIASTSSLSDLINSLKNYPGIKSISIDNIENVPSAGLSVDITTMLK